jgi:FtsH-binding integral membrane protein
MENNNNSYYGQPVEHNQSFKLEKTLAGVYLYMFLGLLVTAGVALMLGSNKSLVYDMFSNNGLVIALVVVQLAIAFSFRYLVQKVNFAFSLVLFVIYSAAIGVTFSSIFVIYNIGAVYSAFLVTAITFLAMSAIGYFIKRDLSVFGKYLLMTLVGVLIAAVVNIFIRNSLADFLISVLGLFIFIGLTAYDTQKIKNCLQQTTNEAIIQKITIWGAFELYIDFVSIFLRILRLMGKNGKR